MTFNRPGRPRSRPAAGRGCGIGNLVRQPRDRAPPRPRRPGRGEHRQQRGRATVHAQPPHPVEARWLGTAQTGRVPCKSARSLCFRKRRRYPAVSFSRPISAADTPAGTRPADHHAADHRAGQGAAGGAHELSSLRGRQPEAISSIGLRLLRCVRRTAARRSEAMTCHKERTVMIARQLTIPDRPKPYVMAHRGNSAACPENTLAAFRQRAGRRRGHHRDRPAPDGRRRLVCIDDGDVDRTTDGHGPVAAMTLRAGQDALSASYGRPEFAAERVPALAEWCAILPANVVLALELKTDRFLEPDVCRKLADELAAAGVLDRTVVLSFSLGESRQWRRPHPICRRASSPCRSSRQRRGRPTHRCVLADVLSQPVLRPAGARGGTDHLSAGSDAGGPAVVLPLAGMRRGAGERSRRERSGRWGVSYSSSDKDSCFVRTGVEAPALHLRFVQVQVSAGFSGQRARPAKASSPEDYLNNSSIKLIVKGGFATGRAKHKGGGSRQRQAPA